MARNRYEKVGLSASDICNLFGTSDARVRRIIAKTPDKFLFYKRNDNNRQIVMFHASYIDDLIDLIEPDQEHLDMIQAWKKVHYPVETIKAATPDDIIDSDDIPHNSEEEEGAEDFTSFVKDAEIAKRMVITLSNASSENKQMLDRIEDLLNDLRRKDQEINEANAATLKEKDAVAQEKDKVIALQKEMMELKEQLHSQPREEVIDTSEKDAEIAELRRQLAAMTKAKEEAEQDRDNYQSAYNGARSDKQASDEKLKKMQEEQKAFVSKLEDLSMFGFNRAKKNGFTDL